MNKLIRHAKIILDDAKSALMLLRKNPKKLLMASALDLIFLFAYGFFTAPLFARIVGYAVAIGTIVSEQAPAAIRSGSPSLSSIIASSPEASSMLTSLFGVFIALAVVVYAVFAVFQGAAWMIGGMIAGRKISYSSHLNQFAVLSIFWIAALSVQHIYSLMESIRRTSAGAESGRAIEIALLIMIFYFASISYALIGSKHPKAKLKNSFRLGIMKAGIIAPAFLLVAAAYFAVSAVLKGLAGISPWLMVAGGIIVIIPGMTWARVFVMQIVERAASK